MIEEAKTTKNPRPDDRLTLVGDGCFVIGPDGCSYHDEQEALHGHLRCRCGCGSPYEQHRFIVDCLKEFDGVDGVKAAGVSGIERLLEERPRMAAEFIAHVLNGEHLLDHGSSVYSSSLTELGRQHVELNLIPFEDG